MTTTTSKNYVSVHIYYNATDLRPVLLGCVDPLVRQLEDDNLLSRYFFIRYWEGGSHVRLRLLAASPDAAGELQRRTETAIREFLEERPSFFDADKEALRPLMRTLFEYEYGAEEFIRLYGEDGAMPIADNNTFEYCPYKPEYDRYGGDDGIELSEQHFQVSSSIALEALRDTNSHLRSSILGLALQLMTHFGFAVFEDKDEVIEFFRGYVSRWQGLSVPDSVVEGFQAMYDRQAPRIQAHFAQVGKIHQQLETADDGVLSKWLRHAFWLRDNIVRLHQEGRLELKPPAATPKEALRRLLTSYIHMMNNRLGVLILEEVYLARMIVRALGATI
jgi:thiopeptide-type bacteriocin biosynthesis protein